MRGADSGCMQEISRHKISLPLDEIRRQGEYFCAFTE